MTASVVPAKDGGDRDLPVALGASVVCHGLLALALALWLVPGQRSSLPVSAVPLVVDLRTVPTPAVEATLRTSPQIPDTAAGPVALAVPTAPGVARSNAPAEPAPDNLASPGRDNAVPVVAASRQSQPASPPRPAVATGTTTLDVDYAASASVALDALAARATGEDFPAEVGKPVRIKRAPTVAYPRAALERQARSSVLALVVVDERGMPEDISILEFEPEFVASAEAALRETRFDPAEDMTGLPIRFYTLVRINFLGSTPGSPAAPR